jgi:hypothetical protein
MTLHSEDNRYRLEVRNGYIYCRQNSPRMMTIVTAKDGAFTEEEKQTQEVIEGYDPDLFHGYPDKSVGWMVDVDCGAQRWYGPMTSRVFYKGIRKLGFSEENLKAAVREARRNNEQ